MRHNKLALASLLTIASLPSMAPALDFQLQTIAYSHTGEYSGRGVSHASGESRYGGSSWLSGGVGWVSSGYYSDRVADVVPRASNDHGVYVGDPADYGTEYSITTLSGYVAASRNYGYSDVNNSGIAVGYNDRLNIHTGVHSSIGGLIANSVNESGQIAGMVGTYDNYRAAVWNSGVLTVLDLPAGSTKSHAEAITNDGRVFGYVNNGARLTEWDLDGRVVRQYNVNNNYYSASFGGSDCTNDGAVFISAHSGSYILLGTQLVPWDTVRQQIDNQLGWVFAGTSGYRISSCSPGGNMVIGGSYSSQNFEHDNVFAIVTFAVPEPLSGLALAMPIVALLHRRRRQGRVTRTSQLYE